MKKLIVSALTATLLLTPNMSASEASKAASNLALSQAKTKAKKEQKEIKIVKEAVDAVAFTNEVIIALEKENKDEALKKLEKAIGKLEVVLASPNAPALIPIESNMIVYEFSGTLRDIDIALITVKALLNEHKIQEARRVLNTLRSEIVIKTVNLPLASYPAALKLAAKFINEDRLQEAKNILHQALLTFVEIDIITPIPLLQAQFLVEEAKKLAKNDRKKALEFLKEAKNSLKIAKALGYTSDSDTTYKMLNDSIEKIENEVKGKKEAQKLFEDLIEKLKEFKEKSIITIKK